MDFKATVKRAATAGSVAAGAVMAATSGILHDPTGPVQQALTAPDLKSAAVAGGAAAVTAAIVGRHSATSDTQFKNYGK